MGTILDLTRGYGADRSNIEQYFLYHFHNLLLTLKLTLTEAKNELGDSFLYFRSLDLCFWSAASLDKTFSIIFTAKVKLFYFLNFYKV